MFEFLLLLNYYQIFNYVGSLLSFRDIYSGFYSELERERQRGRLSDQRADPSLSDPHFVCPIQSVHKIIHMNYNRAEQF